MDRDVSFSSDSVDGAEDMNIVGIRLTLAYDEDEQPQGGLCQSQTSPDTISGTVTHGEHTGSADGQNNGPSSHEVMAEWYNASMVGAVVSGLSTSEIKDQIDSMGAGLGQYDVQISVSAAADSCTNPLAGGNDDNGEEVSYTLELMVFDYTIAPYLEVDV